MNINCYLFVPSSSQQWGTAPDRVPLPPPVNVAAPSSNSRHTSRSSSFQKSRYPHSSYDSEVSMQSPPRYFSYETGASSQPFPTSSYDNRVLESVLQEPLIVSFSLLVMFPWIKEKFVWLLLPTFSCSFWCPCSGLPHLSNESKRHGLRLWTSGKPFSVLSSKSCSYVLYSELKIMRILSPCFFFSFFFLQTCFDCGDVLQLCPICRSSIETRIRLY